MSEPTYTCPECGSDRVTPPTSRPSWSTLASTTATASRPMTRTHQHAAYAATGPACVRTWWRLIHRWPESAQDAVLPTAIATLTTAGWEIEP